MKIELEFLPIPFRAVQDRKLTRADISVLGIINNWTRRDKDFFASNQLIADNLNISSRQVQYSLERLENDGYIIRHYFDETKMSRHSIETTDKCLK